MQGDVIEDWEKYVKFREFVFDKALELEIDGHDFVISVLSMMMALIAKSPNPKVSYDNFVESVALMKSHLKGLAQEDPTNTSSS